MDAEQIAELIAAHLDADDITGFSVRSFEDAMVLTRDAGLVVRTDDGDEFQISVVRSR